MKKLFPIVFVLVSVSFTGCALKKMVKLAQDQQITPSPAPLEVHNDSVAFEISVVLPTKMLPSGKVYTVQPSYSYGDQSIDLDGIEFKAEDFPNSGDVQPAITQEYVFAYDPQQTPGNLNVVGVASDPAANKTLNTPSVQIAQGLITTSTLAKDVAYATYAEHGYNNKEELLPTYVEFFFERGRSNLRRSEVRSDRGEKLSAFIAEKNVTRTVTITGTHSPEGLERINSDLSQDRAEVIENYYRSQMKKYDYKGLQDSINFILKPVVEDWADFKAELKNYEGITDEQKQEYYDIVNGPGEFEDKEDRLQKLGTYDKVFEDVYPKLRTAKSEILTVKEKKTDAEISILAKQVSNDEVSADTLSIEEMLYGATLTPSLKEKEAIYKTSIKKKDTWVGHNNLAAVYIQMALGTEDVDDINNYLDMAMTQLEIAMKMDDKPELNANMASVQLMMGDNVGAIASAEKAVGSLGREDKAGVYGVHGSALLQDGKYENAIPSLVDAEPTDDNMFNRGLAQLLAKEYRQAMESFEDLVEQNDDYALAHYAAAVTAARLQEIDPLIDHLRNAIELDGEFKQKALKDLEFRNYIANAAFAELLK